MFGRSLGFFWASDTILKQLCDTEYLYRVINTVCNTQQAAITSLNLEKS